MDTCNIDRVIIQRQVVDRLPPKLLAIEALDWRIDEPELLTRLCIARDEWEEAEEVKRTADLGLLPVLIVEDMRERDWRAWQREWGLPSFLIGFFLQDDAGAEQMIRGPGTQFFRRLARRLAGADGEGKQPERSEARRAIERALGEALGEWTMARRSPMKEQLGRVFRDELPAGKVDIAEDALLEGDPRRWLDFEGAWFDALGRPGGLFALMRDAGVGVELGNVIFHAFPKARVDRRNQHGVIQGAFPKAGGSVLWDGKETNLSEAPLSLRTGTYRSRNNAKPALCMPEFDEKGNCTGMRARLPDGIAPEGEIRVQIKIAGETVLDRPVRLEPVEDVNLYRFGFPNAEALKNADFWRQPRTIESWLKMRNGKPSLFIEIKEDGNK